MIRLSYETILQLQNQLIDRYGGIHGVRDEHLLDSAINAPYQSFGSTEFYPTVVEKAVRLCFGLVKNHPFIDGNKRIGALALLVLLDLNHLTLNATSAELAEVILQLAAGTIDDVLFLHWVQNRIE